LNIDTREVTTFTLCFLQPWYRGRPLYEEMQKVIKAVVDGSYPLFAGEDLDTGNRGLMSFYYNRQSLHARRDNM
jgi:hypothetical protein